MQTYAIIAVLFVILLGLGYLAQQLKGPRLESDR